MSLHKTVVSTITLAACAVVSTCAHARLQHAQLYQQVRMLDFSMRSCINKCACLSTACEFEQDGWHSSDSALSSSDSSDCCECSDCNRDVDAS